jgi:hypothetical protein
MNTVKVYFSKGDTITTNINGTPEQIKEYYRIGKYFNLGTNNPDEEEDNMQFVTYLEIL